MKISSDPEKNAIDLGEISYKSMLWSLFIMVSVTVEIIIACCDEP